MTDCTLVRPDPQVLFDRHMNLMSAHVLGGAPVIPQSNEFYVAALNYLVSEQFWSIAQMMWRERDPRHACEANLKDMAAIDGVYPKPAQSEQGWVTITGTPGALISPSMQVQFGNRYYRASNPTTVPAVMPATGSITLMFKATIPGVNVEPPSISEKGRLVTPLAGIEPIVTVHGARFCGGMDGESDAHFRDRYLARLKFKPSLTWDSVEEMALAFPCATRVCRRGPNCCESSTIETCGGGRLQLFAMFDDTFDNGIAPTTVLQDMQNWLFGSPQGFGLGRLPIGMCGEILPILPCPITVIYSGLACASESQRSLVEERTRRLFRNLCPETTLCRNLFVALVAQVVPEICDLDVTLRGSCAVTACGDIEAGCSELPVLESVQFV